ncbi:glycosyltransferase [Methylocystis sp. H4A]|uniref:glycosyltransferase family 2 protein n=1 Tax=Methylocystis sp. H4A TaxID=2785788 RepID=UPI0018C20F83|nr:glycosyltransferase family 2 protein [Methylocystis sp. H4A]MBG0799970.1 glycosyltransferase [Methylocystis sp. H4A]
MKISVVTVCYNAAATIGEALESVVGQRGVDVEAIVIDGGSKDGTQEIIEGYRSQLAHFVSEADRGIYSAMNKGLAAATGDFIGFLNADDVFASPNCLSAVAQAAQTTGAAVIAGSVSQVNANGREVRVIRGAEFKPDDLWYGGFPPHPATYVKASLARKVGEFDETIPTASDFDYFLRLRRDSQFSLATIDQILVSMRRGGASSSGLRSYLNISQDMIRALRKQTPAVPVMRVYLRAFKKAKQFRVAATPVANDE